MATIAEYSVAGLSDLDQARYEESANLGFYEASQWAAVVAALYTKLLPRGSRSHTFTKPAGITDPVTSAMTIGDDFSYTTPTETQATLTWSPYPKAVRIDQASEHASVIELINSSMTQIVRCAGGTFDYLAATAAIASTTSGTFRHVGQSAEASITATDTMTLSEARRAHRWLTKASAPKFLTSVGPRYVALVHPDVAFDLKEESSGIFEGSIAVNAGNYRLNVLGDAAGFLWIETSTSAILNADAGSGAVDVYYTMFMGDEALGLVKGPVAQTKGVDDIAIMPDRSMIGRVSHPQGHLAIVKEVGMIANLGFGLVNPEGTYRAGSASSLGANT